MTVDYWESVRRRSAFRPSIYAGASPESYLALFSDVHVFYYSVRRGSAVKPRFYMIHDAALAFLRDASTARRALKAPADGGWRLLVRLLLESEEYERVNAVTRGSRDLAALAAAKWLAALMGEAGRSAELRVLVEGRDAAPAGASRAEEALAGAVGRALGEALEAVREYEALRDEAAEAAGALTRGAGGQWYAHGVVSPLTFLRSPHELRRRVARLRAAALALRLAEARVASAERQMAASRWGGTAGVGLAGLDRIQDVLPGEAALLGWEEPLATLQLLRLLQGRALAWERYAAVRPYIFLDRSGSMGYPGLRLPGGGWAEKIAVAAGVALAIHRRLGGEVYLFDAEVERVDPREVVKTLLTVRAGGGTEIAGVLEEIARIGRRDAVYIVITDGIDEVDSDVLSRVEHLRGRIRFILVPPGDERGWLAGFWRRRVDQVTHLIGAVAEAMG